MAQTFDRRAEDLGNIVGLEHVNIRVPDQGLATTFYITGLGLTRDPYLMTGVTNMWANVGRSQFHLPTGNAQVLRGRVGLVMPDLEALKTRLGRVEKHLAGTKFSMRDGSDGSGPIVDVTCPWGNRIRCHLAGPASAPMALGMAYVELDVAPGTAAGIVRFYREIMAAPARLLEADDAPAARIQAGQGQQLVFRETAEPLPDYDGHHLQIYIADFSGPHAQLKERGLITEESDQYQYRFLDIIDLVTGKPLARIEHEVRSMTHPLYARPLVNRNPAQSNTAFAPGHEVQPWAMPYDG